MDPGQVIRELAAFLAEERDTAAFSLEVEASDDVVRRAAYSDRMDGILSRATLPDTQALLKDLASLCAEAEQASNAISRRQGRREAMREVSEFIRARMDDKRYRYEVVD